MHLQGFKSFAKPTDIYFNAQVIGIVGPNGSGKSNVVDALKWVLGEKSNKQLRGKIATDMIFNGAVDGEKAKFAEVTLVFDNSKRVLHSDHDEITITRKLYTDNQVNEYYINGEIARLKDVNEIFLDSGLNKDSLGIISQNAVEEFAKAKPEARRKIFEEAAGIGLYSKKKDESQHQLAIANENLVRNQDIVNELSAEVKKLQKQAEKATIYSEKKKELTKLELNILGKDINYYSAKLQSLNTEFDKLSLLIDTYLPDVQTTQAQIENGKNELNRTDGELERLNTELINVNSELNTLEFKKANLQSNLEAGLKSDQIATKISSYQALISACKIDLEQTTERVQKLTDEINAFNDISQQSSEQYTALKQAIDDRIYQLNDYKMQLRSLNNLNDGLDQGTRTIVENRNMFIGYRGLVKDFLEVDQQYEKSILAALGANIKNVIVNSSFDAQNAVAILKQNHAGKATFLPLDDIRPRAIKDEYYQVITNCQGFVGVASDLVKYPSEYDLVFKHLLGNTVIADTIENAILISKLTYRLYRIFSLDADVVNPGGSITGGFNKQSAFSKSNLSIEELSAIIADKEAELLKLKTEFDTYNLNKNEVQAKILEKTNLIHSYEKSANDLRNKLYSYELDYKELAGQGDHSQNPDAFKNELYERINILQTRKDKIDTELGVLRSQKLFIKSQIENFEAKINETRNQLDKCRTTKFSVEQDKLKCEMIIANAKEKINRDYKLTLEYVQENYHEELPVSDDQARTMILKLQEELSALGDINFEAIKDLEAKQTRLDELVKAHEELKKAVDLINSAIRELDKKAKTDFMNMLNAVNETLPNIYKYLFGGGNCVVRLVDPEQYLTSGVEIDVDLPGKKILSINQLSGGEMTLVSLAILFSVLKNKSFPLVVLDEAERALDMSNVERFVKIIRAYSDNTQFIIITHQAGTMQQCSLLYGFTMLGNGISKVVKTSVDQAKQMLEEEAFTEATN
jgi:chromosome segregation protein